MIINGIYLDGKTSKRVKARLEVLKDQSQCKFHVLHQDSNPQFISVNFSDVKIESRLGNTPREISFVDDQLFISDEHESIDELTKLHSTSFWSGFTHKLESNLAMVLAATLVTLSLVWFTFTVGVPKTAEYIAFNLPDFGSEHFGSTLLLLDKTMFEPSKLEEERIAEIHALAQPFIQDEPSLNTKLVFRSSENANAFALPDGHIVFTDDIVHLAKNDQELLAILFHEIGHLKYRHLLRRTLQDSMVTLAIILITGDLDTIDLITGLPTILLDLHYSKDFESEADYYAIQQLHKHNMPVDAFANIMKGLNDEHQDNAEVEQEENTHLNTLSDFLSTHPTTQARIDMVSEFKKNTHSQ